MLNPNQRSENMYPSVSGENENISNKNIPQINIQMPNTQWPAEQSIQQNQGGRDNNYQYPGFNPQGSQLPQNSIPLQNIQMSGPPEKESQKTDYYINFSMPKMDYQDSRSNVPKSLEPSQPNQHRNVIIDPQYDEKQQNQQQPSYPQGQGGAYPPNMPVNPFYQNNQQNYQQNQVPSQYAPGMQNQNENEYNANRGQQQYQQNPNGYVNQEYTHIQQQGEQENNPYAKMQPNPAIQSVYAQQQDNPYQNSPHNFPQQYPNQYPPNQQYPPNPNQGQYPPDNQGYPPNNQGYPPNNQGYPPNNQGYPPNNQGYPPPMMMNANNAYPQNQYPPNQQQPFVQNNQVVVQINDIRDVPQTQSQSLKHRSSTLKKKEVRRSNTFARKNTVSHHVTTSSSNYVYVFVDSPGYHSDPCCCQLLFYDDCCLKWICDIMFQILFFPIRLISLLFQAIGSVCCKESCNACIKGLQNCCYFPFRCFGDWVNQCWFSCSNFCCQGIDFIPTSISSIYTNCCQKCCLQLGQFFKNCCYIPINCDCSCIKDGPPCQHACLNETGDCCCIDCCHDVGDSCQNCCTPQGCCEDLCACCTKISCDCISADCLGSACSCCVEVKEIQIGDGIVKFFECCFCFFIKTVGAVIEGAFQ